MAILLGVSPPFQTGARLHSVIRPHLAGILACFPPFLAFLPPCWDRAGKFDCMGILFETYLQEAEATPP